MCMGGKNSHSRRPQSVGLYEWFKNVILGFSVLVF